MNARRTRIPLAFALLLSVVTGCPSSPRAQPAAAPAAYTAAADEPVHARSGFRFPAGVGPFRRTSVERKDPKGDDMSVGYSVLSGDLQVIATVYVYPAPIDVKVFPFPTVGEAPAWYVEKHFEQVEREIVARHKGAALVARGRTELRKAGAPQKGQHCEYSYQEPFLFAGVSQSLRSEAYLFTHGPWFVKYRFTYPEPQAGAARAAVADFMQSLSWPGSL